MPAAPDRPLPRYVAAAVLVRLADDGSRVALALLALDRVDSAAVGGLLVAVLLVPHVVAAPVVGVLIDRARRPARRIALAATVFGAAMLTTGLLLGSAPLGVVVAALLVGGCCGPALTGGLTSQLGALVEPARLPRAFGIDGLTYNTAGIVGPAAAAVLAGAASPTVATLTLGGCALAGALVILTLPIRRSGVGGHFRASDLLAGASALVRDRVLATVTAATSVGQLGAGALPVIVAVAATRAGAPSTAGLVLAAFAAGAVLGSLWWTRRPARAERAPMVVMVGLAGTGVPIMLGAAAATPGLLAALFALAGVANGPLFGALLTTRQTRSAPEVRSQVFTLGAGAKITCAAAGAAAAGLFAAAPTSLQLLLAGSMPVLAAAVGALLLTRGGPAPPAP